MFTSGPFTSDSLRLTMTASMRSAEGGAGQPTDDAPGPAASEPTANLLVSSGDRCTNCGAALAVDQRYCVECGTRRGKPRFSIADSAKPAETAPQAGPAFSVAAGWNRLSAILAVIAVLLAIGVGVLIGNASQAPVKVQLSGASLSSTGSGGSAGKTTSKSGSGSTSSSTCTNGTAGCKNGKQTGNFFGG